MKRAIVLSLVILVSASVVGLEVEEGRIRLTLDESTSRFLIDLKGPDGEFVPLLFSQDPRTSGLDVRQGNRVYRMGDSGDFRQVAEVTEEGVFFVWTSPTLRVAQRFRFVRSVGGNEVDGVQLDIALTNLGEEALPVGVRLLLDTYLGEAENAHFSTPLRQSITREAEIVPSSSESYIRSSPEDAWGLQVMLSGDGITRPELVAVANWKRLAESDWQYPVNEDRNFNRLPYSINDSALLLTYPEEVLERNQRYEVTVQLGGPAESGYLDPETSFATSDERRLELLGELSTILDRIDQLLADPSATAAEVAQLREQLEALSEQLPGQ